MQLSQFSTNKTSSAVLDAQTSAERADKKKQTRSSKTIPWTIGTQLLLEKHANNAFTVKNWMRNL